MIKFFTLALLLTGGTSFFASAQTGEQEQYAKESLQGINTEYIEARPLISGDGQTLFFVRRYHPENANGIKDFQDIWVSSYDSTSSSWSAAKNIGKVLNNKARNAIAAINEDGTDGYFFNTYKNFKKVPLVRSKKTRDGWSTPVQVTIQNWVNVNDYADYNISYKHNVLVLAVEGDISEGQQDLYVSLPDGFGGWKEPKNLGPIINSRESEFAPFLASDGRSLFFCSYGHNSLGGSDIFMSVRLDDTWQKWSTPVNLGPSINTAEEESYFSITDDFEYLYYTSYKATDTNRDILRVILPDDFNAINGPVLTQLDSAAIQGIMLSGNYRVNMEGATRNFQGVNFEGWPQDEALASAATPDSAAVIDTTASPITGTAVAGNTNTTGANAAVPAGETDRYAGFKPVAEVTGLSPQAEELKRYLQQRLPELEFLVKQDGNSVEFKIVQNLEYDFNGVYVTPEYLPRLRSISNILKERENLNVQLLGHTDEIGGSEVNERVARQRVDNLASYFQRRGIPSSRMEVLSFANNEPLAPNDSEANRHKNRRVETILRLQD